VPQAIIAIDDDRSVGAPLTFGELPFCLYRSWNKGLPYLRGRRGDVVSHRYPSEWVKFTHYLPLLLFTLVRSIHVDVSGQKPLVISPV